MEAQFSKIRAEAQVCFFLHTYCGFVAISSALGYSRLIFKQTLPFYNIFLSYRIYMYRGTVPMKFIAFW